jgi:MFS-type transporter involved in bile tolerance (Atg22 family)
VINSLIALLARALFDIPSEFQQLTLPVYGFLTVVGAIAGAIAWHLVATRSRNASGTLRVLVPTVLVLSLIPDVLLLVSGSQPGTTTAGVVALMLMHFGVAAAAVPAYRRFIPPQS